MYDFTPESYATAKSLLDQAIKHDPRSAEAHLVLSLIYHHEAFMGFVSDIRAAQVKAYELGLRATRLDKKNEYAHWAPGISCRGVGELKGSIALKIARSKQVFPNDLIGSI